MRFYFLATFNLKNVAGLDEAFGKDFLFKKVHV